MVRHPKKKQKTSRSAAGIQPLGAKNPNVNFLTDDASKDDEERRLESLLFGKKFVPRENDGASVDDEDDYQNTAVGNEMANLMDSDLFFVDEGSNFPDFRVDDGQGIVTDEDDDDDDDDEPATRASLHSESESGSQSDSSAESSSSSRPSPPPRSAKSKPHPLSSKSRKPPAWTDPSDPPIVAIASAPRLRKLRDAPDEITLSGREYESRLRRQFERIHPEPEWAKKARGSRQEDEEDGIQTLLSSTSGILAPSTKKTRSGAVILPSGTLAIERLRDANQAAQGSNAGEVKVVAFHPSDKVPVLCVGTADRRVRLFNVDGHTSPLLQTLHVPSLPLTSQSSITFHPLGSSLLLTGPRPFFYTHDLQTGVTSKHLRGLWGTTFNTINDSSSRLGSRGQKRRWGGSGNSEQKGGGGGGEGMEITAFSPYPGEMLAVAGRGGYVHLVDWKSGAGQVVASLKCGGGGGGVRALWWAPDRSSSSGALGSETTKIETGRHHLAVLSGDAEVYLWDIGERRCVKRWKDEGGFRGAGKTMTGSPAGGSGGWLAVGSNTGFVNVYGSDSFTPLSTSSTLEPNTGTHAAPKPIKQVANLTTAISTIRFNYDAQLMAIASREKKDAMRLIHLPSLTSFSNWPTSSTPLGHVTAVDFSARSDYLAIGNTKGRVLLYHLKDYGMGSS